jgi:hypothetical protein
MNTVNEMPGNTDFLRQAFATEQQCMVASLQSSIRITHTGDRGEVNEQRFIGFLRKYLAPQVDSTP